jgi:hypothetical protein
VIGLTTIEGMERLISAGLKRGREGLRVEDGGVGGGEGGAEEETGG